MNSSETSSESECVENLRDIESEAQSITGNLLPEKSVTRYNTCYKEFMEWRAANKTDSFAEDVFLVYFNEQSKKIKPSTMWSRWSMLKTNMNILDGINISNYQRLRTFMKNKSKGFKPRKAKVLLLSEITKFINEAPDNIYLAMKVILIFGICGALRSIEFCSITTNDVEDTGSQYIVTIRDTKNYYPRSFVIGANYYQKVNQYTALRPVETDTNRFFLNYQHGKCTRQVVGKNKISEIPRTIALYLNLPDTENYTGHCFRRTSATLLANSGANLMTLKQHGGWRSNAVAEGYIENSLGNKKRIFDNIINSEKPSTSTADAPIEVLPRSNKNSTSEQPDTSNEKTKTQVESTSIVNPPTEKPPSSNENSNSELQAIIEDFHTEMPSTSTESSPSVIRSTPTKNEKTSKPLALNISSHRKIPLTSIENLNSTEPPPKRTKNIKNSEKMSTRNRKIKDRIEEEILDPSVINIANCEIKQLTINYHNYRNDDRKSD